MSKLDLEEIYPLYMRHLLLQELIITDVSLYILSLLLEHKRQIALTACTQLLFVKNQDDLKMSCVSLLMVLEDRFVNPIVLYSIGYCMDSIEYYKNAYDLLNKINLSPKELFYKACIIHRGKGGVKINIEEAMKYYELSETPLAYCQLGGIYYTGKNYKQAIVYFEKGIKLNCPHCKYFLFRMLRSGLGCEVDVKRGLELCESASKQGHLDAIHYIKNGEL